MCTRNDSVKIFLQLCDVISKWEQALRSQSQGKLDTSRMIKLTYKNRYVSLPLGPA